MPYTDYNQVLHDLADNIRESNGSTASIRFVDMPDLINSFIHPRISLNGESASTWKRKLFPYVDTSAMTDMHSMFKEVDTLGTELDLSHFDTSNTTNMSSMFQSTQASSIDLSSFDTVNVTDMSSMFDHCHCSNLDLSSFDTSNVINMSRMFYTYLCTDFDISNFDTSNVTDMSWMFYDFSCSTNFDLDLTHFDTSNVTDMDMMFQRLGYYYSSASITLNVTGWDVSQVTEFASCFSNTRLSELDLSGWNTSNARYMQNMFNGIGPSKIWIPSTFVATKCSSTNKPFISGRQGETCHVYTDASIGEQNLGTIHSSFTMHYNSTHSDYENA